MDRRMSCDLGTGIVAMPIAGMYFIQVVLRLPWFPPFKSGDITVMRAPNILIFLFALILAVVGIWEHFGIPVNIPDKALPLIGSTKEIPPFLAAHSFWVVFTAWLLLAMGVFLPRQARAQRGRSQPAARAA
jgi:hypothetical protein